MARFFKAVFRAVLRILGTLAILIGLAAGVRTYYESGSYELGLTIFLLGT